ncbi:MAG: T9SS type A sorting domain-containing protein [Melioribacteraceae bacterium]|nr:MAG: T9SS type A sorting domain-containing protein [Melioribacteraceae bacterium]
MAPIAQIYCTVSNSAGSDNKSMTPSFSTNCGGCPTLAFNNGTEKADENTLLINSLSNPDVDVTDYYLINTSDKYNNGNIEFIIHEPTEEHSWFDEIELWELKANHGEFIAVTDEGEFVNFKETKRNYKFILNNETDITDYLEAEDGKMYPFMPGDLLRIEIEKSKTQGVIQETETMYATAIGIIPPPVEKVVAGNIYVKNSKNKLPNVTGEDYGLGGFYFRDNLSTVSKKIGDLTDDDAVEIVFNNITEIDYFVLTGNLKTIKAEKLELISSQKGSENLRNSLLTKDGSYAELFPGEEIRFKYNTQQNFDKKEKIKHVLKIVGRYEKEENSGLLASKGNDDGISNDDEELPKENKLFDNYPNPFNPTTVIKYEIKEPMHLSLRIFDSLGRLVEVLEETTKSAGRHEVKFDGRNLSSGFYLYQLTSDNFNFTKKMLLVK